MNEIDFPLIATSDDKPLQMNYEKSYHQSKNNDERAREVFALKTNDLNGNNIGRQNSLGFICFIHIVKQKAISVHSCHLMNDRYMDVLLRLCFL